tara:strand:+ start:602 stop:2464 length:1863 start_codon:yes stop_codon:yes gene_type:complete
MSENTDQTAAMKPKQTDKKMKPSHAKTKSKSTLFSILVVFLMSLSSLIISLQDQDQQIVQTISQAEYITPIVYTESLSNQSDCVDGGHTLVIGYEADKNQMLDNDEFQRIDLCSGTQGLPGPRGSPGINGLDGETGENGFDGLNGTNGTNGDNGINGSQGIDGLNGFSAISEVTHVTQGVCANGQILRFGIDTNADEFLDDDEEQSRLSICADSLQLGRITDQNNGVADSFSANCQTMIAMDDEVYFSMSDAVYGCELWAARGESVVRLSDINNGGDALPGANLGLTIHQGKVWFDAYNGNIVQLWSADRLGVELVDAGPIDMNDRLVSVDDSLYLLKSGSLINLSQEGQEIANGVTYLSDHEELLVYVDGIGAHIGSKTINGVNALGPIVSQGETIWFLGESDGQGQKLHRHDVDGLHLLTNSIQGNAGENLGLSILGSQIIFDGRWDSGIESRVLAYNLDNETLFLLSQEAYSPGSGAGAVYLEGALWFDCQTPSMGTEMCRSDGTIGGTGIHLDAMSGMSSSDPRDLVVVEERVVAFARMWNGTHDLGYALYEYSEEGVELLWDLEPGVDDSNAGLYGNLISTQERLYFIAHDDGFGQELHVWATGEWLGYWIQLLS